MDSFFQRELYLYFSIKIWLSGGVSVLQLYTSHIWLFGLKRHILKLPCINLKRCSDFYTLVTTGLKHPHHHMGGWRRRPEETELLTNTMMESLTGKSPPLECIPRFHHRSSVPESHFIRFE